MRYQFLRFPEGKPKAFTMSYDDGCEADPRFSDTVTPYGLKCTFNLNNHSFLSDELVREKILSRGHEIAVHGECHRAPGLTRPIEGIQDVLNCRLNLEQRFGQIVRGMAYPDSGIDRWTGGSDYPTVRQYLKDLDIAYARALGGDNDRFELPRDWHAWMPTAHHVNPQLMDYLHQFVDLEISEKIYVSGRYPRLFYLWGHSYEFDRNHNWPLLTQICETVSGRDDIWYATNMEIYNYVTAYYSLQYSADGTVIYNPTLYTIWFVQDDRPFVIQPGETLRLS